MNLNRHFSLQWRYRPFSRLPGLVPLFTLLVSMVFYACSSAPESAAVPIPEPVPESKPEPVPEKDPFLMDWAGSTWIIRDAAGASKDYPEYRGFHLGRDGQLLLINLEAATGDTWFAEDNILTFSLKDGVPALPLEGRFAAYMPEEEVSAPGDGEDRIRMLLSPEAMKDSEGLVFELAKANVDIVENHWIPKSLDGGDEVMWPLSREIHLMLLPDAVGGMGILGYGGENRFRGPVLLGEDNFNITNLSITRRTGPASPFENLYVRRVVEANRYIQVDDDLFLYQDTRMKAAFRVRLFD